MSRTQHLSKITAVAALVLLMTSVGGAAHAAAPSNDSAVVATAGTADAETPDVWMPVAPSIWMP